VLNLVCGRVNREGERLDNPGVLGPAVPRLGQAIPPDLLPGSFSFGQGAKPRVRGLQSVFEEMPTAALADEILMPGDGQVRALLCVGGNPVTAWPDQRKTLRALEQLDLLVCLEARLTPTARRADYVVAAKLPLEREDVTLFSDMFYELPYAHYTSAVLQAETDALDDWETYFGLARRLGVAIELPSGPIDPAEPRSKLELLEHLTAGSRIPIRRIAATPGGQVFDEVDVRVAPALPTLEGRLRLTPEGIVEELRQLRAEPIPEPGRYGEDGSYTHLLICHRIREVMNSIGQEFPESRRRVPTNPAWLAPADLEAIGLQAGDRVKIESEHDCIEAVVAPTDDVPPGVVALAHGWGDGEDASNVRTHGTSVTRLIPTDRDYDPISGMVRQSAVPVRVRPCTESRS